LIKGQAESLQHPLNYSYLINYLRISTFFLLETVNFLQFPFSVSVAKSAGQKEKPQLEKFIFEKRDRYIFTNFFSDKGLKVKIVYRACPLINERSQRITCKL